MKGIRRWLMRVLGMSRVEANGLVIFLPLTLFIILIPFIYKIISFSEPQAYSSQHLDSIVALLEIDSTRGEETFEKTPLYKYFNPNTVTAPELKQMGLKEYTLQNWIKYINSGGSFNKVEDIKKIYGLSENTFNNIRPYIKLPPVKKQISIAPMAEEYPVNKSGNKFESKKPIIKPFDINTADTTTLKKLKGIGSVYATRIIKYREMLGGFIDHSQLEEVYGLSNELVQLLDSMAFIKDNFEPRYLDINHFSEWELSRHPYVNKAIAKAIFNYRYQHGNYNDLLDLYNIAVIDSLTISKVRPYLQFIPE